MEYKKLFMEDVRIKSELPIIPELAPDADEQEQEIEESYFETQEDREMRLSMDSAQQISGLNRAIE